MTLIERLKESNRKFWESVDGIKSPEKIKFQIDQKLFTEIISTLEAQEERLKILEGADKAYFDQIPYVDSLVEKLARQEKLLAEAKPYVVARKNYLASMNGTNGPDSEEMNIFEWLAALDELEGKK